MALTEQEEQLCESSTWDYSDPGRRFRCAYPRPF